MHRIALFLDGTWQDASAPDGEGPTNVLRLSRAVRSVAPDGVSQVAAYLPGVGSDQDGGLLRRVWGGLTGAGARRLRNRARSILRGVYRPGDELYIFGFSRGAAIARMLASHLYTEGLWTRGDVEEIRFLGCWDTVASFGIPVDIAGIPFQRVNLFADLWVSPLVTQALHLVAIDEDRTAFEPSLMQPRPGITEVWMPGHHADVGGGPLDGPGLADLSLWEMALAADGAGLSIDLDSLPVPNGGGPLHPSPSRLPRRRRLPRVIGGRRGPLIHFVAPLRGDDYMAALPADVVVWDPPPPRGNGDPRRA